MEIPKQNGSSMPKDYQDYTDSDLEEKTGRTRVLVHQDAMDLSEFKTRRASGDRPCHIPEIKPKAYPNHIFEPDDIITPLSEDSSQTDRDTKWEDKPPLEVESSCFSMLPCCGDLIDPGSITLGRIIGLVISFLFYVGNITADAAVCYHLFLHGNMLWFSLVAGFTIVPTLILNAVSYHLSISKMMVKRSLWNQSESYAISVIVALLHLTQFGIFARYIGYIFLHELEYLWVIFCPNEKRKDYDHRSGKYVELPYLPYLFMIEAILQCLPQFLVQIYILIEGQSYLADDTIQMLTVSIGVSLLNLTRLLVLCQHTKKSFSTSWAGLFFMSLWYLFTNVSRLLSLSLFMIKFFIGFLILCLCHWFILSIWAVKVLGPPSVPWGTCKGFYKNGCRYLKGFALGVTYLLCFMELKMPSEDSDSPTVPSRYLYLFYYSVIFLENSVLIVLWYIFTDSVWYGVPATVITFASFFMGMAAMYVYYRCFHPNVRHSNGWKGIFMFPITSGVV